jgi:hypothetical protein
MTVVVAPQAPSRQTAIQNVLLSIVAGALVTMAVAVWRGSRALPSDGPPVAGEFERHVCAS